jgi:hypothetical protein
MANLTSQRAEIMTREEIRDHVRNLKTTCFDRMSMLLSGTETFRRNAGYADPKHILDMVTKTKATVEFDLQMWEKLHPND